MSDPRSTATHDALLGSGGDAVRVRWLGGGLLLVADGYGLLLDAPPGVVDLLGEDLARVGAVALSGGRMRSCGGILALLCGLEPHRRADVPLAMRFPLGDERPGVIAESWVTGWPGRYPLDLDAEPPGAAWEAGPFVVRTLALRRAEARFLPRPRVESVVGQGFRVQRGATKVVFLPGTAAGDPALAVVKGADLAVLEVGAAPWPPDEARRRLSAGEAVAAAASAKSAWIVGDDGAFRGLGDEA